MVQPWFLLHLSVGCHNFFLHLILLIVKCLFILAAVFLHILAISRREWKKKLQRNIFCGNQNRIFLLCLDARNFQCGKTLLEMFAIKLRDIIFFLLLAVMMFMHIEV